MRCTVCGVPRIPRYQPPRDAGPRAKACGPDLTNKPTGSTGADVKRWRFFADTIVDVGILAEMAAAPFAGTPWFLGLLCFSSMCKALCGVSAGAANTAITQHFASGGADIGEIASKGGAVGYVYPGSRGAFC